MIVALEPCIQKAAWDCGLAVAAMLSGQPYAEVAKRFTRQWRGAVIGGIRPRQLVALCRKLGCPLRSGILEEDSSGALYVKQGDGGLHWLAVFQGVSIDPTSGTVWDTDVLLSRNQWRQRGFWSVQEEGEGS